MSRIESISQVVKEHYAFLENERIAEKAGISVHQVRRLATKMGLRKNKEFLDKKREKVKQAQREYYRKRIKPLSPSIEQLSILYGSLLGDGTLSRGPRRATLRLQRTFLRKTARLSRMETKKAIEPRLPYYTLEPSLLLFSPVVFRAVCLLLSRWRKNHSSEIACSDDPSAVSCHLILRRRFSYSL